MIVRSGSTLSGEVSDSKATYVLHDDPIFLSNLYLRLILPHPFLGNPFLKELGPLNSAIFILDPQVRRIGQS
jgi:hypothetical protein